MYLILGVRAQVVLLALLAAGAACHAAETMSCETTNPFLDPFLLLRQSPASSLQLELEVE
jgi:hypothetical protein